MSTGAEGEGREEEEEANIRDSLIEGHGDWSYRDIGIQVMLYSLDDSYVGPSESTYYIIWNESTDKDATVTVTDVYSKYVYCWET